MASLLLCKSAIARCSVTMTHGRRLGHTVRVILTQDIGTLYEGDVTHVKAGYARNCLIPQKKALYATPKNFERLGMADPDAETIEERRERLDRERRAEAEGGEELKAADLLKYYLRNKVVRTRRL